MFPKYPFAIPKYTVHLFLASNSWNIESQLPGCTCFSSCYLPSHWLRYRTGPLLGESESASTRTTGLWCWCGQASDVAVGACWWTLYLYYTLVVDPMSCDSRIKASTHSTETTLFTLHTSPHCLQSLQSLQSTCTKHQGTRFHGTKT
jgi:hypothetical protein